MHSTFNRYRLSYAVPKGRRIFIKTKRKKIIIERKYFEDSKKPGVFSSLFLSFSLSLYTTSFSPSHTHARAHTVSHTLSLLGKKKRIRKRPADRRRLSRFARLEEAQVHDGGESFANTTPIYIVKKRRKKKLSMIYATSSLTGAS